MKLSFDVAGMPAEFSRNFWTGRAELRVGDEVVSLQSAFRLSTHFELRTRRVWRKRIGQHEVEIVKIRPRLFPGFRSQSFTVSVDKSVVAVTIGK
jgi:hypothetical protein